jgi:hypothetical protein
LADPQPHLPVADDRHVGRTPIQVGRACDHSPFGSPDRVALAIYASH